MRWESCPLGLTFVTRFFAIRRSVNCESPRLAAGGRAVDPIRLAAQEPEGPSAALRQGGDRRIEPFGKRLHDRLRLTALFGAEHVGHFGSMGVEPVALYRHIERAVGKPLHHRPPNLTATRHGDDVGHPGRQGFWT
jgi:hypothetical protein